MIDWLTSIIRDPASSCITREDVTIGDMPRGKASSELLKTLSTIVSTLPPNLACFGLSNRDKNLRSIITFTASTVIAITIRDEDDSGSLETRALTYESERKLLKGMGASTSIPIEHLLPSLAVQHLYVPKGAIATDPDPLRVKPSQYRAQENYSPVSPSSMSVPRLEARITRIQ